MDHVFALHCLIDVYLQRGKKGYFVRSLTIKRPLTVCSADDLKGFLTSNNVQGLKLPFALAQDVCLQDTDICFCICFYCTRMTQLY